MTLCSSEIAALLDGGTEEMRLERNAAPTATDEVVFREKLRGSARDQIVALAVQAKAGVGAFASAKTGGTIP